MHHAFAAPGQRMPRGGVVKVPQHAPARRIRAGRPLARMIGRSARHVSQNIPAVCVRAEVSRRTGIPDRAEIDQHPGSELRPGAPGPADGLTNPDHAGRAAPPGQPFLDHPASMTGPTALRDTITRLPNRETGEH
jgi:hypothetical protein